MQSPLPNPAFEPSVDPSGVTLEQLAVAYWRSKFILLAGLVVGVVIAILYLNVATYRYTATLRVIPAQSDSGSDQSGMMGLAALAGVDIGGRLVSPFSLYQNSVRDRVVIDQLSRNPAIMRAAFPSRWDRKRNQWRLDKGTIGAFSDGIKAIIGLPVYPALAPTSEDLFRFIRARSRSELDDKSQILTLAFDDSNGAFAAMMLRRMHVLADESLRQRMLRQSTIYIDYLERKLRTATLLEQRVSLVQVLSAQEKIRMSASAGTPFAAAAFGDIVVSNRPTMPNPPLVLVVGAVIGLAAGGVVAFFTSGLFGRIRIGSGRTTDANPL